MKELSVKLVDPAIQGPGQLVLRYGAAFTGPPGFGAPLGSMQVNAVAPAGPALARRFRLGQYGSMPSVTAGPGWVLSVRESRHQEWVMMYAAGLSCERIAELCKVGPAAVFAHIREQATIDPGLLVRHRTRAEDPVAPRVEQHLPGA